MPQKDLNMTNGAPKGAPSIILSRYLWLCVYHDVYKTGILSSFFCSIERNRNSENDFCDDIVIFKIFVLGDFWEFRFLGQNGKLEVKSYKKELQKSL